MKNWLLALGFLLLPALTLAHAGGSDGDKDHMAGGDMMGDGFSMMGGHWGGLGMLVHFVVWILLVIVTVYIARKVWDAAAPTAKTKKK